MPQSGDGDLWPTNDDDGGSSQARGAATHKLPVPGSDGPVGWFDAPAKDTPEGDEPHPTPAQQVTQPVSWPVAEVERQAKSPDPAGLMSRPLPRGALEGASAFERPVAKDAAKPSWPEPKAATEDRPSFTRPGAMSADEEKKRSDGPTANLAIPETDAQDNGHPAEQIETSGEPDSPDTRHDEPTKTVERPENPSKASARPDSPSPEPDSRARQDSPPQDTAENPSKDTRLDSSSQGGGEENPAKGTWSDGSSEGADRGNPAKDARSNGSSEGSGWENPAKGTRSDGPSEGSDRENPPKGTWPDGSSQGADRGNPAKGTRSDGSSEGSGWGNPAKGTRSDGSSQGADRENPPKGASRSESSSSSATRWENPSTSAARSESSSSSATGWEDAPRGSRSDSASSSATGWEDAPKSATRPDSASSTAASWENPSKSTGRQDGPPPSAADRESGSKTPARPDSPSPSAAGWESPGRQDGPAGAAGRESESRASARPDSPSPSAAGWESPSRSAGRQDGPPPSAGGESGSKTPTRPDGPPAGAAGRESESRTSARPDSPSLSAAGWESPSKDARPDGPPQGAGREKTPARPDSPPPSFTKPEYRQDTRPPGPPKATRPGTPPPGNQDTPTAFIRIDGAGRPGKQEGPPSFARQDAPTAFIPKDILSQKPPNAPDRAPDRTPDNRSRSEQPGAWPPPEPPRAAPQRVGPQPEPEAPPERKRRRPLLVAAIAIVAVLGIAAGVIFGVPGVSDKLGLTGEDAVAIEPPPAPVSYTPDLRGPDANAPKPTPQGVAQVLAGPIADPALGTVTSVVIDPATGETLYEKDGGNAITPASTGKLLTAAAALLSLDHTDQLVTKVVEGETPGEVIIVGGGDPTINSLEPGKVSMYPGSAYLTDLVDQVKASGAQVNTVYIDQGLYTGPEMAPGWLTADIGFGYITPMAPAMLDGGRADPTVNYSPRTSNPGGALVDEFAQRIGANAPESAEKKAPANAKVLGEIRSAPLTQLVDNMMDHSDNVLAESIAHEVARKAGEEVSFAGAAKATLDVLRQNDFDVEGVVWKDASGLSTEDKVSAKLLAQILAVAAGPDGKDPRTAKLRPLLGGLPVAGGSGTLANRYDETGTDTARGWVRAKTGSLTGVNSLAGIVMDKDNRPLVFAFLTSGTDLTTSRPALDRVSAALRGCGCQ